MAKDFRVTVTGARGDEFRKIFGTDTVAVKSFIPSIADLPGLGERAVYLLDTDLLTDAQREALVEHIAEKFGAAREAVDEHLRARGLPILAEDCIVTIDNPLRWID